ncbi:hypothetical protein GCM10009430_07160 [Aquimarina litoralis]|uniref:Chain length determinant protein n=1 Tax=Aquimarina litoralis TaxID=584605 RepID=A0ABN1II53_9FLAO
MNIESTEEVNLNYIFKKLEKAFKAFLRVCISIVQFYKKKWLLFLGIVIIGFIIGYILDSKYGYSKKYTQEIIIEPKYELKKYIYDFVNSLNDRIKEPSFLENLKLDSDLVKDLISVEVTPVIRTMDILDKLNIRYESEEDFHEIIKGYDANILENEAYTNFYRYHKLTFSFKTNDSKNEILSKKILEYIESNVYFNKLLAQNIKQTEKNLKKNKEILKYLDNYLEKLSKAPHKQGKDIIMIGVENESELLPTISTLLARKQELLNSITNQENILVFDSELFDIVERGEIVLLRKGISSKMMVKIPVLFFLIVSFLFLIKNLPNRIIQYINS